LFGVSLVPVPARQLRKILFSVAMKNENLIEIRHLGITVRVIRERPTRYVIADYTSGHRVRRVRTSLAAAKEKAKEICETLARGKSEDRAIITSNDLRYNLRKALELMQSVGIEIRQGAELLAAALRIVPADELLAAAQFYKANRPDKPLLRLNVNQGITEFKSNHRASAIRKQNLSNFLELLARKFGSREIVDIDQVEIENWFAGQSWSPKTYNDNLQMTSQFWKCAIKNRWATKNPITEIERLTVPNKPVKIYTPDALQKQLFNLCQNAPELVVVAALGAFGGVRIREITRVDWTRLNEALQTSFLELEGAHTKTRTTRYVPISDNLKAWLLAYRKESGPLLPPHWLEKTKKHLDRLNELGRYIQRKTKVEWQSNGWRHSFGTYFLKLHGDPHATITAMGTSIDKLDKHYTSKARIVTKEMAAAWFKIYPPPASQIIPLENSNDNGPAMETGNVNVA